MINEIDVDGSGFLEFPEFCLMLYKKTQDTDIENDLKATFRVFSKDDEGCITAEELKFVMTHLPGKVMVMVMMMVMVYLVAHQMISVIWIWVYVIPERDMVQQCRQCHRLSICTCHEIPYKYVEASTNPESTAFNGQ